MEYFKHEFKEVRDYLHHRAPYLLVDSIEDLSDNRIVTLKRVVEDDFFIQGHFPGSPIFPGAMMQELTTQSAGILIAARYNPMREYDTHDPFFNEFALGVLTKVKRARYKGFARPGDELVATVDLDEMISNLFEFSATISAGGKTIMQNAFQLTNIKSEVLQGTIRT